MKITKNHIRRLVESILLLESDVDLTTFSATEVTKLSKEIIKDLSALSAFTKKIKFTDGSGGGAAKYFGKFEKATQLLDKKSNYVDKAQRIFDLINNSKGAMKDVKDLKFMVDSLIKMFSGRPSPGQSVSGFQKLLSKTPDKMFDYTFFDRQHGITKKELDAGRKNLRNAISNLNKISDACENAKPLKKAEPEPETQTQTEPEKGDTEPSEKLVPEVPKKEKKKYNWSTYTAGAKFGSDKQQIEALWISVVADKLGVSKSFNSWARWYKNLYKTGEIGYKDQVLNPDHVIIHGTKPFKKGRHMSPKQVKRIMNSIRSDFPIGGKLDENLMKKLISKL